MDDRAEIMAYRHVVDVALPARLRSMEPSEMDELYGLAASRTGRRRRPALNTYTERDVTGQLSKPSARRILHHGPSVVWVRMGNTRRELLTRFDAELPTIVAALERGETLIELA
jgi:hypothetical protein